MCKEKWVDLTNLPKDNRGRIKWKDSVGYKCKFIYNDIKGEVEIINYSNAYLTIKYLNYNPFKISTSHFPECKFNKMFTNPQLGINTIWDTAKWMCDLGVSEEDAKKYTPRSDKKIKVKCPNCGREKSIAIGSIYTGKTIGCICGDGISYPEKFITSLLDQLKVNYTKEYSPNWSDNKRYDFYFKINDKKYIIETHGIQHYNGGFNNVGGRNLKEEQENDNYKKELALKNNINYYIELDCRESNIEWIRNSIINSELSGVFNLSSIDWLKCEEFALGSRVKEICSYWHFHNDINNENLSVGGLCEIFNLSRSAIRKYLKKGADLGWCNYNSEEEKHKTLKKNHLKVKETCSKKVEIFKDGISLGVFNSYIELENKSIDLFGTKLHYPRISEAVRGIRKSYKGFVFKEIM